MSCSSSGEECRSVTRHSTGCWKRSSPKASCEQKGKPSDLRLISASAGLPITGVPTSTRLRWRDPFWRSCETPLARLRRFSYDVVTSAHVSPKWSVRTCLLHVAASARPITYGEARVAKRSWYFSERNR
jgi:hypothetical protein